MSRGLVILYIYFQEVIKSMWKLCVLLLLVIGSFEQNSCTQEISYCRDPGCDLCPSNPNTCFFCKWWEGYVPSGSYYPSGAACCDTNAGSYPNARGGCTSTSTSCSSSGCVDCPIPSICQRCNTANGYELSGSVCCNTESGQYPNGSGGCATCSSIISGCAQCQAESERTNCTKCASGYNPNGLGGCTLQPPSCTSNGCVNCPIPSICRACNTADGYQLSGNICCNTNIDQYPSGSGRCAACSSIISGCAQCRVVSQTTTCTSCAPGYNPDGSGGCTLQPPSCTSNGCVNCPIPSICRACNTADGYQLSGNICCNTNIDQYPSGSGRCAACSSIISGCAQCRVVSQTTTCTSCAPGYNPDGSGGCTLQPPSCTSNGCVNCPIPSICRACNTADGYQLSGNICCNTNIDQYPSGSGRCAACSSIISGCAQCRVVSQTTTCTSCAPGYNPDGSGGCTLQPPSCTSNGCVNCPIPSICRACNTADGYQLSGNICCNTNIDQYPSGSGRCAACSSIISGCAQCRVVSQTTTCTSCAPGYNPDGSGGCTLQPPSCTSNGCVNCPIPSICRACNTADGYQLSGNICCNTNIDQYPSGSGRCAACSSIISGCAQCRVVSQTTTCTSCAPGYNPDGSGGCTLSAPSCSSNGCLTCPVPSICQACNTANGFELSGNICCDTNSDQYPDGTGGCAPCAFLVPGCDDCAVNGGSTQCQTCHQNYGFYLSGNLCCNTNIDQYPSGSGRCAACSSIISGCAQCRVVSQTTTCTSCAPGYNPDGSGGCTLSAPSCSSNGCLTCPVPSICQACNTANGFELSGNICCDTNSDQYPDGTGGCAPCAFLVPGCDDCAVNGGSTQCQTCHQNYGFYLSGNLCCNTNIDQYPSGSGRCAACSSIISGCAQCRVVSQTTTCTSCAPGYNPDGSGGCTLSAPSCSSNGCLTCPVPSICQACNTANGFELSGNICCDTNSDQYPDGTGGCAPCAFLVPGCDDCAVNGGSTQCQTCHQNYGFYLSGNLCCNTNIDQYPSGSGRCAACSSIISGCAQCRVVSQTTTCTSCAPGYNPDGSGGCTLSAPSCSSNGCLTCPVPSICQACNTANGFELSGNICCDTNSDQYPDGTGGCAPCAFLVPGCDDCAVNGGSTQCQTCHQNYGFYLSGNLCCNTNIDQYPSGSGRCAACSSIISGCAQCRVVSQTTTCTSCAPGYNPDGSGGCTLSAPSCSSNGCLTCPVPSICQACNTANGFELSGNICCDTNSDQYPDGTGGCAPCAFLVPGCDDCAVNGGSTQCQTCHQNYGFYLSGNLCCNTNIDQYPSGSGRCAACSSIISGCAQCRVVSQTTTCTSCAPGYNPDGSGGCTLSAPSCSSNGCLTCPVPSICQACNTANGFELSGNICCDTNSDQYPDGTGGCAPCAFLVPGCDDCAVNGGSTQCQTCHQNYGFYLSGNLCCNTNIDQYPSGSGRCAACSSIISGCAQCRVVSQTTTCTSCAPGYNPDGSGGCTLSAPSCSSNGCLTCPVPSICQACNTANGFELSGNICCDTNSDQYPDGTGGCAPCAFLVPGCDDCAVNGGSTQCQTCHQNYGFYLSGNLCCNTNIDQYPSGSGRCAACSSIISGCAQCRVVSQTTTCTSCAPGYNPDGSGGCTLSAPSCSSNGCLTCPVPSICQACNTANGFELSGNICCDTNSDQYPDGTGGCAPCAFLVPGCDDCDANGGATQCQSCNTLQQYARSGTICCNTASSTSLPTFPDGQGDCDTCNVVSQGCISCTYNFQQSLTQCLVCSASFTLSGHICCDDSLGSSPDGSGGCTNCPSGCLSCTTQFSSIICTSCDTSSGFYLSGNNCCNTAADSFPDGIGSCTSCSAAVPGCFFCIYDVIDGLAKCLACDTVGGYADSQDICCNLNGNSYPDGNGGCNSCSSVIYGCSTCAYSQFAGATQCTACSAGFQQSEHICCDTNAESYPDGSGACANCSDLISGCSTCDYDAASQIVQCTACMPGYQPNGVGGCTQ